MSSNKKVPNFIYGLAVIAAVVGIMIFKPAEAPVTDETDNVIVSSVTESETALSAAETEKITEILSETQASVTSAENTAQIITEVSEKNRETAQLSDVTETYYFRNQSTLDSHYEKHGIEMGFASAEEYEAAASAVINSPDALYKTEKEDGDGVYYIEQTNEFAVLSTDGYIRTYFLPSAGKAYFDRQ
ncbi:MAG: hypothetical protein IJ007_01840 [Oscillospiraceae bacterium]|nr:hypothetical protein [Oscillospiraceae bacterium]